MMSYLRCFLFLLLVLSSTGCIKIGDGGDANLSNASVEATTSTTPTTMSTTSTTTSTSTTTTFKPETTYTTIRRGTCYDGIRNQGEEGIDCGGPCKSCSIDCASDEDCGSPHYARQYCKEEGDRWYIMRDLVSYECKNPGEWNASCILVKNPETVKRCRADQQCLFTNYCPGSTYTGCEEARCILKEAVCDWIICLK